MNDIITLDPAKTQLKWHPAADVPPRMTPERYHEFVNSVQENRGIAVHGFLIKVDGELQGLDGRHRWQAAEECGYQMEFKVWTPTGSEDSPWDFVLAVNGDRRHLEVGQRAMMAAEAMKGREAEAEARRLANLNRGDKPGSRERKSALSGKSSAKAGKALGVSARSVESAVAVAKADPALAAEVKSGAVTLNAAVQQVKRRPPPDPVEITDGADQPVTDPGVQAAMVAADEFKGLIRELRRLKKKGDDLGAGIYGRHWRSQQFAAAIDTACGVVKFATPYAACPYGSCKETGCKACGGDGWLPVDLHKAAVKDLGGA